MITASYDWIEDKASSSCRPVIFFVCTLFDYHW